MAFTSAGLPHFCAGYSNSSGYTDDCFFYEAVSNTWEREPDVLSSGRSLGAAIEVGEDLHLITGGTANGMSHL